MTRVIVRKLGKTFSYIFKSGKTLEGKSKVVEKGGFSTKHLTLEILNKWMRELQKVHLQEYNFILYRNRRSMQFNVKRHRL